VQQLDIPAKLPSPIAAYIISIVLSRGVLPVGFTRISSPLTVRATGVSEGVLGLDDTDDAADGVVLSGRDANEDMHI
jgi:hypothetical protein